MAAHKCYPTEMKIIEETVMIVEHCGTFNLHLVDLALKFPRVTLKIYQKTYIVINASM